LNKFEIVFICLLANCICSVIVDSELTDAGKKSSAAEDGH